MTTARHMAAYETVAPFPHVTPSRPVRGHREAVPWPVVAWATIIFGGVAVGAVVGVGLGHLLDRVLQ